MIHPQPHPTVEIPPWDPPHEDQTDNMMNIIISPQTKAYFAALHHYLPSSTESPLDSDECDEFRMYEFKVRKCTRVRSHDWTECPYAHPGEKARRRDPRRRNYSATPCPEFRRGSCRKGDLCEFAHGVFESWLHPTRYRTQPCNDGLNCRRRVCFFAHTPKELRLVVESPRSGSESPPVSPSYNRVNSVAELVGGIRGLQIGNVGGGMSPRGTHICGSGFGFSSPSRCLNRGLTRSGLGRVDPWEVRAEGEVPTERVESGKGIRARMYAKLSKENSLDWGRVDSVSPGPDFGWVSELVN